MEKLLTVGEFKRMSNEYAKVKYTCHCGHRVIIPKWVKYQLCGWCGSYVFKNKKDEFEYRMNEKMKRRKLYESK